MVSRQRDIPHMLEILSVDDIELVLGLATAFHVIIFVDRIKYGAVDAVGQFDRIRSLVILSVHQSHSAKIVTVRYDQFIGIRQINEGVWLSKARYAVNRLAAFEVEDFNRLVVFGGQEETVPFKSAVRWSKSPEKPGSGVVSMSLSGGFS